MKPCCNPRYITVNTSTRKKKSHRVMAVPCGHCVNCLANNQRDWVFRMKLELQVSESAYFVTLTLDDDHIGNNTLKKKHLQDFVRLLRQKVNRECDRIGVRHLELRYFGVGEYGKKTNRAHYHIMLFNLPFHDKIFLHNLIASVWKKGFVYVEDCVAKNIGYICKYITKLDPREHEEPPFPFDEQAPIDRSKLLSLLSRNGGVFTEEGQTYIKTPRWFYLFSSTDFQEVYLD